MASIKDALVESIQEDFAVIKYVIFTFPLFYTINLFSSQNKSSNIVLITVLTVIFLFGLMLKTTRNVRCEKLKVLPSFNIFKILWAGFKGLIALAPLLIGGYFLDKFLVNLLNNFALPDNIVSFFTWAIYLICLSFAFTGYVLYSRNFKILDTYNFKYISKYCIDILIEVFFMLVKLVFVDALIILPVTYLLWLFFGIPSPVAIFFWSMVFVLNIVMIGHYIAQMEYEKITEKRED